MLDDVAADLREFLFFCKVDASLGIHDIGCPGNVQGPDLLAAFEDVHLLLGFPVRVLEGYKDKIPALYDMGGSGSSAGG